MRNFLKLIFDTLYLAIIIVKQKISDRDRSFDLKSIKDLSRKLNKRKEQKGESNTKVTDAQRITKVSS